MKKRFVEAAWHVAGHVRFIDLVIVSLIFWMLLGWPVWLALRH